METIKVLYIHHSGVFGGASRSLLESISVIKNKGIKPIVLLPEGSATIAFKALGIETISVKGLSQFDNTKYGYYRGFRWLIILREILLLPFTLAGLLKAKKMHPDIDIVHINEITNLPSLIFSTILFKQKKVMHIRSLQRSPQGFRNKVLYRLLNRYINKFIAIDYTVADSFIKNDKLEIIHNGLDINSSINNEVSQTGERLKGITSALKVAFVGNLLYMKGIVEFVQAAAIAKNEGLDIKFIIVGNIENKKQGLLESVQKMLNLSHDAKDEIIKYIKNNSLENYIEIIDFTNNIKDVYSNIDVLCFPSHLDAAGRPVFEAGLFKKPSIVAVNHPKMDTIVDYKTGICIEAKNSKALFDAVLFFYKNKNEVQKFGEAAYDLAMKNFDIIKNSEKLVSIYKQLITEKN